MSSGAVMASAAALPAALRLASLSAVPVSSFGLPADEWAARSRCMPLGELLEAAVSVHAHDGADPGNRVIAVAARDLVEGRSAVGPENLKRCLEGDLVAPSG